MIKLSDYVMRTVAHWGIKHVFMFPGGGAMHLVDSLGKCRDLKFVCNLHEQASAICAEAYSQYTNNFSACLVTTGPGGTNALTGVAGAWLDSTPMIVFSGQVKRADLGTNKGMRQMGPQEIDIVSIVKPVTKYAVTVLEPNDIKYHMQKAFFMAKNGRPGPVWLDIPLDVQSAMIDENNLRNFVPDKVKNDIDGLNEKLFNIIDLINHSKRPVIIAGNGIRLSGVLNEFRDLIEFLNIPILTSWKATDFLPEKHRLFCGRPGILGQRGANFVQQNSDCLIMLGTRMDLLQLAFNSKDFAREAKKVVVDIDLKEIKKFKFKVDIAICSDVRTVIGGLLKFKRKFENIDRTPWIVRCREWNNKYPVVLEQYWKDKKCVNLYALLDTLSDVSSKNDVFVPGSSGQCSEVFYQSFRVKDGQRILNTPGLGAMGFGLPASMGACLASGLRRTICINGDGGFQLNIQELETLHRLNLPIKYFILNNGGYASIKGTQKNIFSGHYVACNKSSGLTLPDIRKLADAYGIKTAVISNHIDIKEKVKKILAMPGPVICEVMVSIDQVVAPKVISKLHPDGTATTKPMEDMWPFLEREELVRDMIVKPLED